MTRYIYILLVIFAPICLQAQVISGSESTLGNNNAIESTLGNNYNSIGNSNLLGTGLSFGTGVPGLLDPMDVQLQTGASYGTMGYGGNYFQSYLSPSLTMPINKKFAVSAGLTYSHTTFNNLPTLKSNGELGSFSGNLNTLTMHTSGIYRANEKLTFTGSAFKTLNPSFNERLNPEALQMEAKGFSFGVDYKLGENTHIGAEIRYQQGNGNLYNPYNGIYSPYRHNSVFGY